MLYIYFDITQSSIIILIKRKVKSEIKPMNWEKKVQKREKMWTIMNSDRDIQEEEVHACMHANGDKSKCKYNIPIRFSTNGTYAC